METNDLNQTNAAGDDKIELTKAAISYLNEIRKWAFFLAIIGFVFVGIMVLASFSVGAIFSSMGQEADLPFPPSLFGAIYFVMAIIYFFPIFYLFKFASHAREGLLDKRHGQMDLAFMNLKSHYKFMGIFTIVTFCTYVLIAIIFVIVFVTTRSQGLQA